MAGRKILLFIIFTLTNLNVLFSQIDTILCKITPIGELLQQLNDIKYATTCSK